MKKILLSVIILIFAVLSYLAIFNNIEIGNFKIGSISNIKAQSSELDGKLNTATVLTAQTYSETKSALDTSIANLKTTKQKYEDKIANLSSEDVLKYKQINNYDKEFLWTTIGTYATNQNIDLNLDIVSSSSDSYYDLSFTIVGEYSDVSDFIYSLENNDELKFKIENFSMQPYSVTVSSYYKDESGNTLYSNTENPYGASKSTTYSGKVSDSGTTSTTTSMTTVNRVQATFTVKNINVNLD